MKKSAFFKRIEEIRERYHGKNKPTGLTYNQIQARLVERGSNFRRFALDHGYAPRTVTQVVTRWAGKNELPVGRKSFRILVDLSHEIGQEVTPGILNAA